MSLSPPWLDGSSGGDLPDDAVRCFIYSVTYDGNLGIFYIQKKEKKKRRGKKMIMRVWLPLLL